MITPEPSALPSCVPNTLSLNALTRTFTTDGRARLTIAAVEECSGERSLWVRSIVGEADGAEAVGLGVEPALLAAPELQPAARIARAIKQAQSFVFMSFVFMGNENKGSR
jgi:hypothetical protein